MRAGRNSGERTGNDDPSSGWRFLTPEEYAQLGPLADDPSVRLVAVAQTKSEGNVPTFVVTGGALSTERATTTSTRTPSGR